jgi:transposase
MPWTKTALHEYARRAQRYSSNLTDREWALIAPLLPGPRPVGRPRTINLREVLKPILYMASAGCTWALLPKEFPHRSTVQRYFCD